ncbi:MAG: hypothetical protein QXL47_04345 [Candidatus Anstonellales archaeon]
MEIAYEQVALIFFAIVLLLIGVAIVEKVAKGAEVETENTGGGGMCYFASVGANEIKAIEKAEGDCVYNASSKGFSIFDFENAVVIEECRPVKGIVVMEKNAFAEGENITIKKTSEGFVICETE